MSQDHVPASMQRRVRERAEQRCEYRQLAQEHQEATFHIDHVTPRVAGGATTLANLALACVSCSLRKGPRQAGMDPESGQQAGLFDPRNMVWAEHFHPLDNGQIEGSSALGRATVELLKMNRPLAIALRRAASERT